MMTEVQQTILKEVTDFYLGSHDFNGIPVRLLAPALSADIETLRQHTFTLIESGLVSVNYEDRHPNPHIKALEEDAPEVQIDKLTKPEFQTALKYTDLVLKLNPKDIVAIVQKCALNSELGYQLYQKQQKGDTLSVKEGKLLEKYKTITIECEKKAFSLGWKPETPEEREKYLQTVKEEKLKRAQQQ
jgi:hypothetical protein